MIARPDRPLLYVCHAPADEGWVQGRMLPALGLVEGQYRTRADDRLGQLQLTEIVRAIEECLVTVVIVSSASRWDPLLEHVSSLALHAAIEAGDPRFLVATRDIPLESLSLDKRALVGLDCSDEENTVQSFERLRKRLELKEPAFERPPCPYPGLDPFTANNRHLLFGRDDDRDQLLHRIRTGHSKILLYGPSGTGKSSLVHSAVLPELPSEDYLYKVVESGGRLMSALHAAILALEFPGIDALLTKYLETAWGATDAELEQARLGLDEIIVPDARRRILVVDPLEEIFAEENTPWRTTFFHLLAALWSRPWCTVILCMRADFLGMLMSERCWRELDGSQRPVLPLDEAGLRGAIVMPARQVGVHVEEGLVERLIREADLDRTPVPLPLLQVALKELWARLSWRYLTLASYESIIRKDSLVHSDDTHGPRREKNSRRDQRGLAAVLAVHADRILHDLTGSGDREIAKRVLLDLIHLGEGRPHTRRRRTLQQLQRRGDPAGQLERVLDRLVVGRLITTGAGDYAAAAERHFDLAHDALIDGWSVLATWVKEERGALAKQRQLEAWAQKLIEEYLRRSPSRMPRWIPLLVVAVVIVIISGPLLRFAKQRSISECERAARSNPSKDVVGICLESYRVTRDSQELRWAAEASLAIGDLEGAGQLAHSLIDGPSSIDGFRILSDVKRRMTPANADATQQEYAAIAFAAAMGANDGRGMVSAMVLLSKATCWQGDFTTAMDAADRALRIAERLGDASMEVSSHLLRADVLRRVGDVVGAAAAVKRASERMTSSCDKTWMHLHAGIHELDAGPDERTFRRKPRIDLEPWMEELSIGQAERAERELAWAEDSNRECGDAAASRSIHFGMARLMRETNPPGALENLNRVSKPEDDRNVESLLLRGYLAADRGAFDEADGYLVRAEGAEPLDPEWAWRIAQARAEVVELRGGPFVNLMAEYYYLRSIAIVSELRGRAQARSAYLLSSHRGPYDGFIELLARAGRWRDVLEVLVRLDASDMLGAAAAARDGIPLDLMLLHMRPATVEHPPPMLETVLAAWRSRELVIVIAPSRHQIGRGREHTYRVRINGGQITGADVGDANVTRRWAQSLFDDPGDDVAARALGAIIVPPDSTDEPLDVLAVGSLRKVPLAALRDDTGAPMVGRRPLARVLSILPGSPSPISTGLSVVIANSVGDRFSATLEGYSVASVLGYRGRLAGAFSSVSATRGELWAASRAELLHVVGQVDERDGWRALLLSDGAVTPDEIVQHGLAPRLAVLACSNSAVAHDEEGWGSIAAALLAAGTQNVIATERPLLDGESLPLMQAFYAQSDWRTDPVRALARVQTLRARAEDEKPNYSWAAFTVLRRPPSKE